MARAAAVMTEGAQKVNPLTRTASLVDFAAVLSRLGGDTVLLRELASIFLQEYPALLGEMGDAIAASDAESLQRAAHSLKGSVSNFAVPAVTDAVFCLEIIG